MAKTKKKDRYRGKRLSHYEDGKPVYKYFSAHSDRELQRIMVDWERERNKPKTIPFKDVANDWFDIHSKKIEENTAHQYEIVLQKLIDIFSNTNIHDITVNDVQRYINDLYSQSVAKSTIIKRKIMLSQIFKYCMIKDYLSNNPVQLVSIPSGASKKSVKAITENDIKVIHDNINEKFGFFPFFLLYTGCRRSEAVGVTWDDIDMNNMIISINKKVIYINNQPRVINYLKNKDDERTIYIANILNEKLKEVKRNGKYLFSSELDNNLPMKLHEIENSWEKYLKKTGLNMNLHQLRHTYATMLNKAGVDVKTAQMLLGHKDIKMTMNIYTHIENEQLKRAKNMLDSYLE